MVWLKLACFKTELNLIGLIYTLVAFSHAFHGIYMAINGQTNSKTIVYHLIVGYLSIIGELTGAHRLWSHRSFKANKMIQVILITLETYCSHNSVYVWVRDHRVHHKFTDSEADPYNVNRGLFYAQMGWFLMKKTKEYDEKVKTINLDDVRNDKLVMFQHRHYWILCWSLWTLSAMSPWYFWNESLYVSFCTLMMQYFLISIHVGLINSISHWYGWKPYDTGIEPTFSRLTSYMTLGEGYHNFHHTFPEDYSQSELNWRQNFNVSALLIDFWEYCGWVSHKKVADPVLIQKRRFRTGNMNIKIAPPSAILDQILGFTCFTWALWIIFGLRYLCLAC